jgi:hypothetical protein
MKIKRLIFFAFTGLILSGITTIVFISVSDKEETIRLLDQNQVKVPDTHSAASISKGAILLLLSVGVIGVLGVSRKKKDTVNLPHKSETNRTQDDQDLN